MTTLKHVLNNVLVKLILRTNKNIRIPRKAKAIIDSNLTIQYHLAAIEQEITNVRLKSRTRAARKENYPIRKDILTIKYKVPNIMAGKNFSHELIPETPIKGVFCLTEAKGLPPSASISQVNQKVIIKGTFKEPKVYNVLITGVLKLPDGKLQIAKGELALTVIADPKSLWKNLPSDPHARFPKPDHDSKAIDNRGLRFIGASIRGRSHAHKGTHRDDHFNLITSNTAEWHVLAVADGAGSCKYSRRGSEIAAIRSTKSLRESLSGQQGDLLENAFLKHQNDPTEKTHRELQKIYQHTVVKAIHESFLAIREDVDSEQSDTFKDFSTTLILAAIKKCQAGYIVMGFGIGDGCAVIYNKNKSIIQLTQSDSGEFAGQTRFLDNKLFQDSSVYSRISMHLVDNMTSLILATDGITDAKFETESMLAKLPPWDALWHELSPIVEKGDIDSAKTRLIQWMDFWSPGNHDDRTIVLCIPKGVK